MLVSRYIEDIFINFVDLCDQRKISLVGQDWSAVQSFSHTIHTNNQLTKNQANFIIKILQKYKNFAKMAGLDYAVALANPQWRNTFRVLDLSKKISVEKDEDGALWTVMKFPFSLKETMEKEISPVVKDFSQSIWDSEHKVRKLKFYNYNPIELFEFAQKHNFEIDDSFMVALANVEEIWENSDEIVPHSVITDMGVELRNPTPDAKEFWIYTHTQTFNNDLLLAKSMGFPLKKNPENIVEKIAASKDTHFHLKSLDDFFNIYKSTLGKIVVIVNKGEDTNSWVKNFCETSKKFSVDTDEIRVCYRLDKQEDRGFNQWVKDSGYGGKVDEARILIFQNKPPKWLFSDELNAIMILTNSLYPVPSATTQAWMESHPCVCYIGDFKAAGYKDRKIVEL